VSLRDGLNTCPMWRLIACSVAMRANTTGPPRSAAFGRVRQENFVILRSPRSSSEPAGFRHFPTNWKKQKPRSTISRAASLCI
jgi:hypothetical protein